MCERVARFARADIAAGASSLVGALNLVEHKQGALDTNNLAQRASDRTLARVAR